MLVSHVLLLSIVIKAKRKEFNSDLFNAAILCYKICTVLDLFVVKLLDCITYLRPQNLVYLGIRTAN